MSDFIMVETCAGWAMRCQQFFSLTRKKSDDIHTTAWKTEILSIWCGFALEEANRVQHDEFFCRPSAVKSGKINQNESESGASFTQKMAMFRCANDSWRSVELAATSNPQWESFTKLGVLPSLLVVISPKEWPQTSRCAFIWRLSVGKKRKHGF